VCAKRKYTLKNIIKHKNYTVLGRGVSSLNRGGFAPWGGGKNMTEGCDDTRLHGNFYGLTNHHARNRMN